MFITALLENILVFYIMTDILPHCFHILHVILSICLIAFEINNVSSFLIYIYGQNYWHPWDLTPEMYYNYTCPISFVYIRRTQKSLIVGTLSIWLHTLLKEKTEMNYFLQPSTSFLHL